MDEPAYCLGVDIGTTSTKAALFNKTGGIVSSATISYPLHTPSAQAAEQDPEEIFRAVVSTVRETMEKSAIDPGMLKLISFSSAMHTLIAIGADNQLLTRSITWADSRAAKQAARIKEEMDGHAIYLRTGTPVHAMAPLSKILWLKEEQPEIFEKTAVFADIKSFVFHKLFGEFIVDHSIASATGLFNFRNLDWDSGALAVAGIGAGQLPKLVPTTHQLKGIAGEHAVSMGIPEDVPFIIGASDGALANLGLGATAPGTVAVTIGTSGAVRTVSPVPKTDPKGRTFCYALTADHWVIGGAVNNGGIILRWLRDEFAAAEVETAKRLSIDPYDVLTRIASTVNPGSDGLIFHPYLTGERAPLWDSNARGSFFGLSIHHQKQHMIRAVLEGIIYNLYTVLLAVEELNGEPTLIKASGGFARSEMWRQLMADIFGQPVTVPESFESSCLGAVVLGMYALGEIEDFSIVNDMIGHTHIHEPDPDCSEIYQELLPIYIRLSRLLTEEYGNIADFQRKHLD